MQRKLLPASAAVVPVHRNNGQSSPSLADGFIAFSRGGGNPGRELVAQFEFLLALGFEIRYGFVGLGDLRLKALLVGFVGLFFDFAFFLGVFKILKDDEQSVLEDAFS